MFVWNQGPCHSVLLGHWAESLRLGSGVGRQCPLTRVAALPTQHPPAEGACDQPPRETQADLQPGG